VLTAAMRRTVTTAFLAGLWLLATGAAAGAHAVVRGSDPASGATLDRAPQAVVITFTEAPERGLSTIRVLDASGRPVEQGAAAPVPGKPLQLRVALGELGDGSYTVSWRVLSRVDGHVTAGSFAFGVGVPAVIAVPAPGSAPLPRTPPPAPLAVAGRWALYWGLALLVGAAATGLFVFGWQLPGGSGVLVAGALALAAAGLVAMAVAERSEVGVSFGRLLATDTGQGLLRQGIALAVTGAAAAVLLVKPRSPALLLLTGVAAAGVLLAHVVAGHAARPSSFRALNLLAQWVHVVAVGVWIGGLVWLLVGLRGRDRPEQVAAVARFSRLAGLALAVVALTGLARAADEVGSPQRLLGTGFGRALSLKVALVGVLVTLAALNRYRILPALAAGAGRLATLRASVRGEILVAVLVLLAAAVLSKTPPASPVIISTRPPAPPTVQVSGNDYATTVRLTLTVTPGLAGPNTFTASVVDYDSKAPVAARRVALRFSLPARPDIAASTLELAAAGEGLWRGQASVLSLEGRWRVTALVQGPSGAVTVPVEVQTRTPPELLQVAGATGPPPPDPPDAVVLGGQVGGALVGFTAFQRSSTLLVRVRGGLVIPPPIAPTALRLLTPRGQALTATTTRRCGDGCLETLAAAPPAGRYTVEARFPKGTARFELPVPLPRPAAERLRAADRALAAAGSYRIREALNSGRGAVYRTDYLLKAPDRARWHLDTGTGTADTVWIGETRWSREDAGPWKKEATAGITISFPARNWSDREGHVVDLGPARIGRTPVTVLAFIDLANGAYHRLWVDHANRILRERMHAPGHFMDRDYAGYAEPVEITAPR